ncbi:MAG: riboflavin synthase, partial [Myxococcales bacterium]|nr:riboflavin synthase [Myxococcales bacterium]
CNGVCLTVIERRANRFNTEASLETLRRSNLGSLHVRDGLHLERALRVGDRLGGHWVSGHVDGVGRLAATRREGDSLIVSVDVPAELMPFVALKGSIAFDGVSLTVSAIEGDRVSVTLVPFTLEKTRLARVPAQGPINIEVDLVARYVVNYLRRVGGGSPPPGIDEEFLRRHGFA